MDEVSHLYNPTNYVDSQDEPNGEWRSEPEPNRTFILAAKDQDISSKAGTTLRQTMAHYFLTSGSVPWQGKYLE